ncbi:uncharacterized protein LOC114533963 isoform X2 [Dendronephthya gigantea]|uniref:uncharacterized protein LOC114533963 isoform X2 n=1 Tax=Dendronephthya gigantea TaxID=151771 RepID=UPI00106B14A4|nr:uncharacterized protein LOC114533963 isoform X2 [Dendronephthya gigantea]
MAVTEAFLVGHRLNISLLECVESSSGPDCVHHCLSHKCCRSVNYRKSGSCNSNTSETCELLHLQATENLDNLEKNKMYDHYTMVEPQRAKICDCLNCKDESCLKENCSCTYDKDKGKKCTDGNFNIHVNSLGYQSNPQSWGHAIIKINGKDYSNDTRGFNFVVIDGKNGYIEDSRAFDTHLDATDMTTFVKGLSTKKNKIIIAAVKDDGEKGMTAEAYAALSLIAPETVTSIKRRGSFAMIGFSETKKPPFVKVIKRNQGKVASVIDEIIHIPIVIN